MFRNARREADAASRSPGCYSIALYGIVQCSVV